jgi:hypothetical protein
MPAVLHGFAENQPVTPMIETIRALLMGTPVATTPGRRSPGSEPSRCLDSSHRCPCSGAAGPAEPFRDRVPGIVVGTSVREAWRIMVLGGTRRSRWPAPAGPGPGDEGGGRRSWRTRSPNHRGSSMRRATLPIDSGSSTTTRRCSSISATRTVAGGPSSRSTENLGDGPFAQAPRQTDAAEQAHADLHRFD